jgi:alkylhydroperoxidase family enzyme
MARVPFLQDGEVPPEVQRVFDACVELHGRTANSIRAAAHTPAVVRWMLAMTATLQKDGLGCVLDARTRALAMIKVSAINECLY